MYFNKRKCSVNCASFPSITVIHFPIITENNFVTKRHAQGVKHADSPPRGPGRAKGYSDLTPPGGPSPQRLTLPEGSTAELPVALEATRRLTQPKRHSTAASSRTRGRLVPRSDKECLRTAPLASPERSQHFSAFPQVANEAGSDTHAQTRPPRT